MPIYEDFDNALGQWGTYDTYDRGQAQQLTQQAHIDLRTFDVEGTPGASINMSELDALTMQKLDTYNMGSLDAAFGSGFQEIWSDGAVGRQPSLGNFTGITLACAVGANATNSVTGLPISIAPLADGYISLALPNFPASSLDLGSCYLDISSDDSGNFASGLTDSLPFTASTTTLSTGNMEARFPVSLLVNAALDSVYAVQLRFTATSICTVTCLAIRVMAPTWTYAPVDINTLYGYLQPTVPPTGSLIQSFTFPTSTIHGLPSSVWPIMLFSDGNLGYQLLDTNVGVRIHAGQNTKANSFTFYLREFPITPYSMTTLDTMTMGNIEALGAMPDGTPGALDDFSVTQYLSVTMQWGTTNTLTINNQDGLLHLFTPSIAADSDYYFQVTLEGASLRAVIYPVDTSGVVTWDTPVFDTTALIDPTIVVPRNGRLGFFVDLRDGDTWVKDLRPQSVVFSQFETNALNSVTPVDGVRLYTDASPPNELFDGLTAAATGVQITPNNTKSNSGHCVQVQCNGTVPNQGVNSNLIRFQNFAQTEINFDLLLTTDVSLALYLIGDDQLVPLPLPEIPLNQWTSISVDTSPLYNATLPGSYQVVLLQTTATASIWYLDNFSVPVRTVAWFGRGSAGDPWQKSNPAWIDFKDAINTPYDGAMLGRGNSLQIRGQIIDESGFINGMQVLPKYSELGNFSWSDERPASAGFPVAVADCTASGYVVTASGAGSTAPNGLMQYLWDWGDGTFSYGMTATHVYGAPVQPSYTVTLTVIDQYGLTGSQTKTISNTRTELAFTANFSPNATLQAREVQLVHLTASFSSSGTLSDSLA